MRVTFLGTGTSHGVPMIGCSCAVCRSTNPRNQRLRPSILIEYGEQRWLVDATPDLRTQVLRAGLTRLNGVLITHTHADHVLGLDDLRVFCGANGKLPVFASPESLTSLQRVFPYGFTDKPAWPGLPSFTPQPIEPFQAIQLGEMTVLPLPLPHGRMPVLGFLFDQSCAYLTDCSAVTDDVVERVRGVPALIIDGLRHRPHPTHLTIAQALEIRERIQPQRTYLTHLCHEVEHEELNASLPAGVQAAHDGLVIEVER